MYLSAGRGAAIGDNCSLISVSVGLGCSWPRTSKEKIASSAQTIIERAIWLLLKKRGNIAIQFNGSSADVLKARNGGSGGIGSSMMADGASRSRSSNSRLSAADGKYSGAKRGGASTTTFCPGSEGAVDRK